MGLEDTHRAFLQTIIQGGCMSHYELKQVVMRIFNEGGSHDYVTIHIEEINERLEPYGLSIKSGKCEFTGETLYTLTFGSINSVIKLQKEFSKPQLELLNNVFLLILDSEEGFVSSTACLNLCSSLQNKMTSKEAEQCLQNAYFRKWLYLNDGNYYMGTRSIIELMPHFKTYRTGFNKCFLCKNVIYYGRRCESCNVIAHLYCLATYAKFHNALKCTNCNNPISADNLPDVGDDSTIDSMDVEECSQVIESSQIESKAPKRSRKRR